MSIVPTYNLTAIQTPTPQAPSQQLYVQNAGNPGIATKSMNLAQGDTGALITKFNKNALAQDLNATYGGGGFGVLWGLELIEAGGLNLSVGAGAAMIHGLTQVASSTVLTLPASSTGLYIWLQDNGTLTYQNGSLTPPSAACVYLGFATTSSSAITALDFAGIVKIKANVLWRRTGDAQAPGDSPPSSVHLVTQTSNWTYEWDGVGHRQRVEPGQLIFKTNGPSLVGGHLTLNYAVYSGSGTLTLAASSANIQRVIPTATMTVLLPASGVVNPGMSFQVYNDSAAGSGKNVLLKDSTGTTTISTITPKLVARVVPTVSAVSTFGWPTSITPADPAV